MKWIAFFSAIYGWLWMQILTCFEWNYDNCGVFIRLEIIKLMAFPIIVRRHAHLVNFIHSHAYAVFGKWEIVRWLIISCELLIFNWYGDKLSHFFLSLTHKLRSILLIFIFYGVSEWHFKQFSKQFWILLPHQWGNTVDYRGVSVTHSTNATS